MALFYHIIQPFCTLLYATILGFYLWPLLTLASLGSGHIALAKCFQNPAFKHEVFLAIINLVISYLAAGGYIYLLIWVGQNIH